MIIGEIRPSEDGKPFFKILRDHETPDANVRPCAHHKFTLDEKWSTVTCNDCGERIDPFSALLYFCQRWEDFERKRQNMNAATRDLYIESLRKLARRVDATAEEKREIDHLVSRRWSVAMDEARELLMRMEKTIGDRRRNRKRAHVTQAGDAGKHFVREELNG